MMTKMAEQIKPELILPVSHFKKMMAYVDLCAGEVTGFFEVEWEEDRRAFVMGEIYLIKQEAGAADVEMDEEFIADFLAERIAAGADQMPRGWWHSHVNMGAFFSGTDDNTINNDFLNDSYTVSLVVNKRREMKATLVVFEDGPYGLYQSPLRVDDLKISLEGALEEIPEALRQEVLEKVQPHKPIAQSYQYQNQNSGSIQFKGKKISTKFLPKEKEKALEKIQTLDLQRRWNGDLGKVVYEDDVTEDIWEDKWDIITWQDYSDAMPGAQPFLTSKTPKKGDIVKPRRCLNCHYWEGGHNADVCPNEEYGPEEHYWGEQYDMEEE